MVDVILVERACKGDGEAFGEIYGQVYEKCVKYIRGMCKDETLAEQVVQDTVLHFIENDYRVLKDLQDYSKFESYFFSAATNRFRNIYKRGRTKGGDVREVIVDEIYDVNEDARLDRYFGVNESMTPEELLEHQELKEILMSMVNDLPESQKEVVYLHYFNEWKQSEVAEYLEANLNTVKSALQRAKESLHRKVEAYEKKTGTKLHSVVPILPFLHLVYANEKIACPDLSVLLASAGTATAAGTAGIGAASAASTGSGTAAASVGVGTAAASVAAGTAAASSAGAGTTAGAAAAVGVAAKVGGGIVTKVVAGVLAAAVVGTGAVVVPKMVDNTPADEPAFNETVVTQPEEQGNTLISVREFSALGALELKEPAFYDDGMIRFYYDGNFFIPTMFNTEGPEFCQLKMGQVDVREEERNCAYGYFYYGPGVFETELESIVSAEEKYIFESNCQNLKKTVYAHEAANYLGYTYTYDANGVPMYGIILVCNEMDRNGCYVAAMRSDMPDAIGKAIEMFSTVEVYGNEAIDELLDISFERSVNIYQFFKNDDSEDIRDRAMQIVEDMAQPATFFFSEGVHELTVGEKYTPTLVGDISGKTFYYVSTNDDVATVNEKSGEVTAISEGVSIIVASTETAEDYTEIYIKVHPAEDEQK